LIRKLQEKFKKLLSFSPPIFYGRGFFQYSFGMVPKRVPINVVFGKPIKVEKIEKPT